MRAGDTISWKRSNKKKLKNGVTRYTVADLRFYEVLEITQHRDGTKTVLLSKERR